MSSRSDNSVFASLQQVTGATYDNAEYNKDLIDVYMLRKARNKGLRLPTGGPPAEYKYLGAHVETPTAGMNENVVYIDVSSMYPSFILTLNASPETIVGTRDDLKESQYTEEDCVWGYIDTRPVKHLADGEPWQQYTDGQYKMVYDPHAPAMKWSCDEGAGPRYEKVYFLKHDVQKGFLTECVEELIALKNQYRGTSLYGSTKRVTNCFDTSTTVVTENGQEQITDVEVGDYVETVEPNTGKRQQTEVKRYYEYDAPNTLISIENEEVALTVTPEHHVPVRPKTPVDEGWDDFRSLPVGVLDTGTTWELPYTNSTFDSTDITITREGGPVACVELEDSSVSLFAGKEGKYQPADNSLYGVLGFATEESSFRLFDWRIAEAITLSGRKMIQFSRDYVIDYLADEGYEAVAAMGDTDGVGISVPGAATRHEAMELVEEAVESLNGEGYDGFFQREFGVSSEHHHGEIEIESFAPKVFIPAKDLPHGDVGRKKRYIQWETWNDDDGDLT